MSSSEAPDGDDTNLFGERPARDPHAAPIDAEHFVRVAVERGIDSAAGSGRGRRGAAAHAPDAALTYATEGPIPVGRRVEVPLGRGSTPTGGIVVESGGRELLEGLDPAKVKRILRTLDGKSDALGSAVELPRTLVELARWMAGYYVCPIGMTLAAMIPAAVKRATGGRRVELVRPVGGAEAWEARLAGADTMTPAMRRALAALATVDPGRFPLPARELADLMSEKTVRSVNRLLAAGVLEKASGFAVRATGGAPIDDDSHAEVDPLGFGEMSGEGDAAAVGGRGELPGLAPRSPAPSSPPPLTKPQAEIVEGVWATADGFAVHLLRGITGSGKTEVYLHLIERLLEHDGRASALVLVPEISLTPQMGNRFRARLGRHGVAVLHSGLSASQRHEQWRRASLTAEQGGARVVVGARSAVFAPLTNVGLIVVDEEHASDYKQDQLPRYHGRDVAIKRAQIESCPIVLGSATPSLESWSNAVAVPGRDGSAGRDGGQGQSAETPKYRLWELTERIALKGSPRLPSVTIVDIAEERRAMARHRRAVARSASPLDHAHGGGAASHAHEIGEMIGPTLEAAMRQTLGEGGQAVLLLNRRGYAGYISCADQRCGWVLTCDDCDATMVHHRRFRLDPAHAGPSSNRLIRCHHCLAQRLMPGHCPDCGKGLIWLGLGTQRVEEEVLAKFGDLFDTQAGESDEHEPHRTLPGWLVRADGDTMTSGRDWFDVLARFGRGDVRVLLGTQMIAKGLDFPNVRLVGVINADTALSLPDFRAGERTFQLISQVAGRAGRGEHPGRVFVQTMEPRSPTIVLAAKHDYVGFATRELDIRKRSHLPPSTRMARIVVRDEDLDKAMKRAGDIAAALSGPKGSEQRDLRVVGPLPCPIARIARQFRVAVELTASRRGAIQSALARVREQGMVKSDARTAVDVDPIALL